MFKIVKTTYLFDFLEQNFPTCKIDTKVRLVKEFTDDTFELY